MTRFMKRGPADRRRMLAQVGTPSATQRDDEEQPQPRRPRNDRVERDPVRRPIRCEDLSDQILARNGAPAPRVARLRAVVAHEEVLALGDVPGAGLVVAAAGPDVGLAQLLAVDEDGAAPFADGI